MTAPASIQLTFCAQTNVGKVRKGNEDNFLILDLNQETSWSGINTEAIDPHSVPLGEKGAVVAVSDGMGGALAGEVASRMAVEIVRDILPQLQTLEEYDRLQFHEQLRVAIEQANSAIHIESLVNADCRGMGATFTAVALKGENAYFAQVGDSRAHLIRQNQIIRITKDQSVVQQLIDLGQITEEEAETHSRRNIILQALGAAQDVDVVVSSLSLRANDILLLCSDGLSGKVSAAEMAQIVAETPELNSACEQLIRLANERGGEDNITVLLLKISGEKLTAPTGGDVKPDFIARSAETPNEFLLEDVGLSPPAENANEDLSPSLIKKNSDEAAPIASPAYQTNDHSPMEINAGKLTVDGRRFAILFISVALLLSLGAVLLNKYFVGDRAVLQQKLYQENQALIADLRTRIDALRQKNSSSPEIISQLDLMSKQLDEAAAMGPTKYPQIGQTCVEVGNAIALMERKQQ